MHHYYANTRVQRRMQLPSISCHPSTISFTNLTISFLGATTCFRFVPVIWLHVTGIYIYRYTTTCVSGMFAPVERRVTQGLKVSMQGAKVRSQGAKVGASISTSRYGIQQQHAPTTTITTTDRSNVACMCHCVP